MQPKVQPEPSLEATSPYEMRVQLGDHVEETDVRTALKTGDMGFLHSFTTGSAVDGPGIRVVAWTTACMFRCRYCHNPDTWTLSNGIPVSIERAIDGLRKYAPALKVMKGGFTLSGGEPLMQHRFAVKLFAAAKQLHIHTAIETNGFFAEHLSDEEL
jgi:pyruvate formate lyase activating enzyme